ncbi:unnamed protein product [Periconia digitata]|uniref:Uncharacterized protein n=1 Tax=Periconia digitata TaxID=1303443 RepID=A0A9W4XE60_9PLEO|nr:unnamed protein product [Periconia digitata]
MHSRQHHEQKKIPCRSTALLQSTAMIPLYGSLTISSKSQDPSQDLSQYEAIMSMLAYTTCSLLIASAAEIIIQGYAASIEKYVAIIPLIRQHSNLDVTQEASPGSQNTWSSGSAFSGIFILQLSCVFQPAGSFIFEGAIATWRFSPLYCLLDIVAIYRQLTRIILKYKCSLSTACLSVSAARYRSYRNIAGAGEQHDPGSIVLQDIEDVGRVIRRRRLMAISIGLIGVFQFIIVMAVQGPPETVAVGFVLACIYFSYWATNEAIAAVVRLAPPKLLDDAETVSMCLYVRPQWFCMSSGLREYMAGVWHFVAVGVLAAAWFGAGFGGMELGGSKVPYFVDVRKQIPETKSISLRVVHLPRASDVWAVFVVLCVRL